MLQGRDPRVMVKVGEKYLNGENSLEPLYLGMEGQGLMRPA